MSARNQPPAVASDPPSTTVSAPAAASPPAAPISPSAPTVCAHVGSGLLDVEGDDAIAFLHGQLSSDVKSLSAGRAQYWSYNSPKGRMLANGVLWRPLGNPAGRVVLLLAGDLTEAIRKRLSMFVLRSKVTLADSRDRRTLLGLAGPGAAEAAREALGIDVHSFAVATFNGDASAFALPDGRILVACPPASAPIIHAALTRHAAAAGADAWRRFGIAAGVPKITAATSDLFVPQALNWDLLGGIDFQKGCYPGQEIVARMQYLGRLKERLYAFRTDAENVAPATRLYSAASSGEQPCGTVVNAAPDTTGGSVLLAVVQLAAVDADDVRLNATDGPALVRQPLPYAIPDAPQPRAPRKL